MGFADKLLSFMKFNDADDDYDEEYNDEYEEYDEDEYEEDEAQEQEDDVEEEAAPKKPLLSFRRKKKPEPEEEKPDIHLETDNSRVIPFHGRKEEGEIVKVIKPQEFNEAQIVADFLKEGKTIVVNLEGIEISQAQRIIDFIGGASFAVDGTLKAISNNIFIVAPGNIEVSGDLRDEIISDSMLSPELGKF
jgi:cell division inhibitor SepF